ncbi:hypothetical protein D3C80_1755500 [compost metagenome]
MLEMLGDQQAQCRQRFTVSKIGIGDHFTQNLLAVTFQQADQIVSSPTKAMQGRLADASRFGQLFQRGSGVDHDCCSECL